MADSKEETVRRTSSQRVEIERTRFKSFLLQNPNYFGNLEVSDFKPIKVIKGNTTFEQMVCVGLNPPYDRLEAVVQIKAANGYGGDICGPGSLEYVRFYVDLSTTASGTTSVSRASASTTSPARSPSVMPSVATSTRSENSVSSKTSSRCARSCNGTCRRLPIRPTTRRCGATSSTCRCRFVRASSSRGAISSRSSKKFPSSFPIRSARSSRVSIRPSS